MECMRACGHECRYFNDVFVFDALTSTFGAVSASASSEPCLLLPGCGPLPLNNNVPQTSVHGRQLYVVGGEADVRSICGEAYQHYPRLALQGTITTTVPVARKEQ
jgi:hypothetical protein